MDPNDYKLAVAGEGNPTLVADWKDKPHRLVYDLATENELLRQLLWLRHDPAHCAGLYGDDGEMQCGACLIDFKRDDVKDIERRFIDIAMQKMLSLSTKG